jgi:predicted peptidase
MPPYHRLPLTAVLVAGLAGLGPPSFAQTAAPRLEQRTFTAADGASMRYGLAVPGDYDRSRPRPLVLALHPGGSGPYYGDSFLRSIFLPGLRELEPIMIAPDVPGRSWTDPRADQLVMALVAAIGKEFAVDARRLLVVGFSMGGAGTWHHAARHPDRFTAAIVIAGRTEEPLASLGTIPTFIIHSRDDQVVPFAQAEERARALEGMKRPVRFEALAGVSHYAMGGYLDALTRAGRWVSMQWNQVSRKDSP